MRFQTELIPATLLRRYKRFLADCRLEDGREITAHVANPGAMTGLSDPGARIWLEPNDNPKRKLNYTWRLVQDPSGALVGVDTSLPNRLVKQALMADALPELTGYDQIRPEIAYGTGSRIDFLLTSDARPDCYLEVKSVTLRRRGGLAEFPDCVTARGAKHLRELAEMSTKGARAVLLYLIQRDDCTEMAVAEDLDPGYGAAFTAARAAGLEVLTYACRLSPTAITLGTPLPLKPLQKPDGPSPDRSSPDRSSPDCSSPG